MNDLSNYHPTVTKIISLIEKQGSWYETFKHKPVTTSEEAAQIRTGYTLEQGAKALILRARKNATSTFFCMIVVAGSKKFNSKKVIKALGVKSVRFATPQEVSEITHGIKVGGVPPLGCVFNVPTYIDTSVAQQETIIFNAGDRGFSIALRFKDYHSINSGKILSLTDEH